MSGKSFFIGLVVILALTLGVVGGLKGDSFFGTASPTGSTFNTAKVAAVVMTPSSNTATSSSILNSDVGDRIVLDGFVSCPVVGSPLLYDGTGPATWVWTAATTSTAAPALFTSTVLAAMKLAVTTSTSADSYGATTTYTNTNARRWNAGSYMTFQPLGTTTATCVVGVHYIGS